MSTKQVTFSVVPANVVSRTRRAPGKELSYLMIVGVSVDGQNIAFRHPEYAEQVKPGVKSTTKTYTFPAEVADRIMTFAQKCLAGSDHYDGWDFTDYIIGAQPTPSVSKADHSKKPKTKTAYTHKVVEGKINLVADSKGMPLKSFYGLGPNEALTVLGSKGTFGITPIKGLKEIYGGSILGYELRK